MRQPGYYWCKYKGEWTVAKWAAAGNLSMWIYSGYDFEDSFFEEIDERRIERKPTVTDRINEIDEEWRDLCLRMQKDIDKNPEWT